MHRDAGRLTLSGTTPASRIGQLSWAFYEFASGPYYIMVNIFVLPAYFANAIAADPLQGQSHWGYIQGAAGFMIALTSPFLGALSDAAGPRKPGLALFTALGIAAMASLWFATPGAIAFTAAAVMCASVTMEFGSVYHQALLPAVVSQRRVGLLSGLGYALNNAGAMITFAIWLAIPAMGLLTLLPEYGHERSAGPLAALWLTLFALPLFLFTPDEARKGRRFFEAAAHGVRTLGGTLIKLGHYRNVATFMVARMLYYDGLNAVFVFIGIYAAGVFGWTTEKVGLYGLIVIVFGVVSAVAGGWLDDRLGSKRTIAVSLALFMLGLVVSIGMTPDTVFYFFPVDAAANAKGVAGIGPLLSAIGFSTLTEQLYVLSGIFAAIFIIPAQASSRTMLTRLAPTSMVAEFFGLYALTGRATSWLAPTTIAAVTAITQSQRGGFAVIFIFVAAGLALLLTVREERAAPAP